MSKSAIVLFAHGSRDDKWSEPLQLIRESIAAIDKEVPVSIAFLEFMQPTLMDVIASLATQDIDRVTLIPLFVSAGKHLKSDLTSLLAETKQKHPSIRITLVPSLGESEDMRDMIADWAYRTHRNACRS